MGSWVYNNNDYKIKRIRMENNAESSNKPIHCHRHHHHRRHRKFWRGFWIIIGVIIVVGLFVCGMIYKNLRDNSRC